MLTSATRRPLARGRGGRAAALPGVAAPSVPGRQGSAAEAEQDQRRRLGNGSGPKIEPNDRVNARSLASVGCPRVTGVANGMPVRVTRISINLLGVHTVAGLPGCDQQIAALVNKRRREDE